MEVDLGRRIESVARVFGTDFADELRGDRENNRLYGGEGNDTCVTDTPDFTEGCEKEGRGG